MFATRASSYLYATNRSAATTAARSVAVSTPSSSSSPPSPPPPSRLRSRPRFHAVAPFSSEAASVAPLTSAPPPSSGGGESSATSRGVYMWGTSKKNALPMELLLSGDGISPAPLSFGGAGRGGASSSSGGGGLFSGDGPVVDFPSRLDETKFSTFFDPLGGGDAGGAEGEGSTASVEKLICGASGSAAILDDGRCFVWGSNKNGELGIGSLKETTQPKLLSLPNSDDAPSVISASLGPNFSAVIDAEGGLYTFGYGGSRVNGMGCLGHGSMDSYPTPTLVMSVVEDGCVAVDAHCGEYSLTVLTTEGEVLTCGSGSYGRLGNLESIDQLYLEPVEMMSAEDVVQIAGGFAFSLALNAGGIVHAWGRNNEGQLGTGMGLSVDMYAMESLPSPIEGDLEGRKVVRIAAGNTHAAAVTDAGELFTWGMNATHQPKLENTLLHAKIVDVACGKNYTLALDSEGRVYSMGKGKTGVLGLASTKAAPYPIVVEGIPADQRVVAMSCGWAHVACMTEPVGGDGSK